MSKEIVNQVQEAHSVPAMINPRRNTPRHVVIKLTQIKSKIKRIQEPFELLGGRNHRNQVTGLGVLNLQEGALNSWVS